MRGPRVDSPNKVRRCTPNMVEAPGHRLHDSMTTVRVKDPYIFLTCLSKATSNFEFSRAESVEYWLLYSVLIVRLFILFWFYQTGVFNLERVISSFPLRGDRFKIRL